MISIALNGRDHELNTEVSVGELLEHLNIPPAGTAVAINSSLISRERHDEHRIRNGDSVEIIRAIGGG